jgi:DNA ligase-associated metallophosphoesterase
MSRDKVEISEEAFTIDLSGEQALLLSQKAVFLTGEKVLLLSDLHIGKSSHFRREGLAVPASMYASDLLKLGHLINQLDPAKVFILGDLFHVGHNNDVDLFKSWKDAYREIDIILIKGNHDRFDAGKSSELGIEIIDEYILNGKFLLRHVPGNLPNDGLLTISGHIHPAVRIFGKGKQSVVLSCFHLSKHTLILPAFGEFTGRHIISPDTGDRIFAVVDDGSAGKVVEIR